MLNMLDLVIFLVDIWLVFTIHLNDNGHDRILSIEIDESDDLLEFQFQIDSAARAK